MTVTLPPIVTIDVIIACLTVWFIFKGYFNGLVKELLGVASLIGAYLLTAPLHPKVMPGLQHVLGSDRMGQISAYILVFMGLLLTMNLASKYIAKAFFVMVPPVGLSMNRLSGALFGTLKALLIVTIALFVVAFFSQGARWTDGSRIVPVLQPAITYLGTQLEQRIPESTQRQIPDPE